MTKASRSTRRTKRQPAGISEDRDLVRIALQQYKDSQKLSFFRGTTVLLNSQGWADTITMSSSSDTSWWPSPTPPPWTREPNEMTLPGLGGFDILILRHPQLLTLCGYVRVPIGHPLFQQDGHEINSLVDVHGGITFAGRLPGRLAWWLGFDCSHAGDFVPGLPITMLNTKWTTYRAMPYVLDECKKLQSALRVYS